MSTEPTPGTDAPPVLPAAQQPANRGWLLVLLPAGFGFGVVAGFLQEHRISAGSLELAWAGVLAVATLLVTIRALTHGLQTRLAGGLFFTGWLIATALLALPNPSGDIVFTADLGAYGYLLAGTVLGGAAAAWPLPLPGVSPADRAETGA